MNQSIDIAANLSAKGYGAGDPQVDAEGGQSTDAFGNKGQEGQYGAQGQYGAVTGGGFGGGLAKDAQGNALQGGQGGGNEATQGEGQKQGERKHRPSVYEGMELNDSTSTGGYGKNSKGGAFSRANQMGADNTAAVFDDDDDEHAEGKKTGYSTPGYLREGEDPASADKRNNVNVYGQQADDRGSKNHDDPEI